MGNSATSAIAPRSPLAVVGLGCRLPGGASSPDRFWSLLAGGVDAIGPPPADRIEFHGDDESNRGRPGRAYAREGGFLAEAPFSFDGGHFNLTPSEAERMSSAEILLLKTAYEAIEDGGLRVDALRCMRTGVFVGDSSSTLANTLSLLLEFKGPSVRMGEPRSSSLVAFHFGCRSLWADDCDVAVVAGVNILTPTGGPSLSPDGRRDALDESAQGYARGEGCGVVILKRLDRALADRDRVRAIVLESDMSKDGKASDTPSPNRDARRAFLQDLYRRAGVAPSNVQYVEARGTGNHVSDQAEAESLHDVFARERHPDDELFVGELRTNVGYLESAAGIVGVIKAVLCLEHRQIPANLDSNRSAPRNSVDAASLGVSCTVTSWPRYGERAYSGVHSSGSDGVEAHVLLAEAPRVAEPTGAPFTGAALVPLSAKNRASLMGAAENLARSLKAPRTPSFLDVAYTLAHRRDHYDHRVTVVAEDAAALGAALAACARGETHPALVSGAVLAERRRGCTFVYAGMGPQWWAMGRELMSSAPVFGEAIRGFDERFRVLSGWSVVEALGTNANNSRVASTDVAQPATAAIQIALTLLLRAWGVRPDAIVGHSLGEVAGAYAAGALSLDDAVLVSFHRGRLHARLIGTGSMLAAGLSEREALGLVADYPAVSMAAVNSPSNTTLSGPTKDLEQIAAILEKNQIFQKRVHVDIAYHSAAIDRIGAELRGCLAPLRPRSPEVPIYSTVTGTRIDGDAFDADYFWRNTREPVRFADAVLGANRDHPGVMLQVGPHPVFTAAIRECFASIGETPVDVPTLARGVPERWSMARALATLFCLGRPLAWNELVPTGGRVVSLPTYSWTHPRYAAPLESSATRGDTEPAGQIGPFGDIVGSDRREARRFNRC